VREPTVGDYSITRAAGARRFGETTGTAVADRCRTLPQRQVRAEFMAMFDHQCDQSHERPTFRIARPG
jgi:hypothetical protein